MTKPTNPRRIHRRTIQCSLFWLISTSVITVHCLYTVSASVINANPTLPTAAASHEKRSTCKTHGGFYCEIGTGNSMCVSPQMVPASLKNASTKMFGIFVVGWSVLLQTTGYTPPTQQANQPHCVLLLFRGKLLKQGEFVWLLFWCISEEVDAQGASCYRSCGYYGCHQINQD